MSLFVEFLNQHMTNTKLDSYKHCCLLKNPLYFTGFWNDSVLKCYRTNI